MIVRPFPKAAPDIRCGLCCLYGVFRFFGLLSVQSSRDLSLEGNAVKRKLFEEDHEMFREMAAEFNVRAVAPHYAKWDEDHMMSRDLWSTAG